MEFHFSIGHNNYNNLVVAKSFIYKCANLVNNAGDEVNYLLINMK